jgi:hypothetical protein
MEAEHVTVLCVMAALAVALSVGYAFGRRAGRRTPTWKQRTGRVALGKQLVGLVALLAVHRLQRTARRQPPAIAGRRLPWPAWR